MKFYPRSWAKYPEAVPGTLKLLPPEYRFAALEADYNSMQDMLYGDVPTFETVIAAVQELEDSVMCVFILQLIGDDESIRKAEEQIDKNGVLRERMEVE